MIAHCLGNFRRIIYSRIIEDSQSPPVSSKMILLTMILPTLENGWQIARNAQVNALTLRPFAGLNVNPRGPIYFNAFKETFQPRQGCRKPPPYH